MHYVNQIYSKFKFLCAFPSFIDIIYYFHICYDGENVYKIYKLNIYITNGFCYFL